MRGGEAEEEEDDQGMHVMKCKKRKRVEQENSGEKEYVSILCQIGCNRL